ncbi:MAG: M20/M25/M40 family metallo-hydrolase [Steroidobacteraceae bacterium]
MKLLPTASVLASVLIGVATAAEPTPPALDPQLAATLAQLRDAAMSSDWSWQRLEELTDRIGPRLSGSAQLALAINQVSAAMRLPGVEVRLQPARIPHWVRGEEHAELIDYPAHPQGLSQPLHLTALGSSSATPAGGLTARVIVVHDFDELHARAAEVRGSIVLFEVRFDQRLADNGEAMRAYEEAGAYRFVGPSAAAELGAAAALVRSIGGADYRLPHTGATIFKPGQTAIPAAALTAEDADLVTRLAAQGPVTMKLLLTPRTLPDVDSANVIADWPGSERPDEYVVVSGHLDSWDLATGATDDGVGAMAAAGVIRVLQQLNVHARRTIRFIGWTNEENGGRGNKAYFDSVQSAIAKQAGAIESDSGAGRALGILAGVAPAAVPTLQALLPILTPIGAGTLERRDEEIDADIGPLQQAGVPAFAPLVDTRHYFDYHHTAADTLDKVDPQNLKSQVATMAVLAFYLAQLPDPLPRLAPP